MHISRDFYLHVRRGHLPPEQLLHLAHRHLLEVCPACRREFVADQQGGAEQDATEAPFSPAEAGAEAAAVPLPAIPVPPIPEQPIPEDPRAIGAAHLARRLPILESIRTLRDLTRRHLQHLLQEPPETWTDQVAGSRSRYRLRAFAERLIEESRRTVRNQPELARRLAALVPEVLRWIPGAGNEPWSSELQVRATAWQANALRVSGELRRAEALLAELPHRVLLRGSDVAEWVRAEIASLRASLFIDQRRFAEARRELDDAREIFARAGDAEALARTLIQQGNLFSILECPADALQSYDEAFEKLDRVGDAPDLRSGLISARIGALTKLERYGEAQRLLDRDHDLLHPEDDPHLRALNRHHQGRIALGLGDLEGASRALLEAQEIFLELHRHHDALLPSLDLAQVHLEAGRLDELHELAADLVVQFRARGVARETLAALRLLAQAAAAREVSRELLGKVREQVRPGRACVSGDSS